MVKVNLIIIVIVILVISVSVIGFLIFDNSDDNQGVSMSINYFDADKNLVNQKLSTLSIINNVPEVAYITLTITTINTGDIPLNCNIVELHPSLFDIL